MVSATNLRSDVESAIANGDIMRFRYFTKTYDADDYDDAVTLAQSGTDFYTSGLIFPLKTKEGSEEASLVEQGLLLTSDSVIYVTGTVLTSGLFKIGLGSPQTATSTQYGSIPSTEHTWKLGGVDVYKKLFVRNLTTGSLAEN